MNNYRSDDVTGSTVGLHTDLTHQGHLGRSAILVISGQSHVEWKLSVWKSNVNRPWLYVNCGIGWHSIGDMNNYKSDDVNGSTVGLYTDLTHQGHVGRIAILAMTDLSDVKWKLSGLKCTVRRSILCKNCQIRWQSIESKNSCRSDDVNGSTVGLYTDLTHQGHESRSAILALSGQSDVRWKLSGWKSIVYRP
jgi:uncharacterized RmlC-like cupin family protein